MANPATAGLTASPPAPDRGLLDISQPVSGGLLQVNDRFITVQEVLGPLSRRLKALAGMPEDAFRRQAHTLIAQEIRDQAQHILLADQADKDLSEDEKKWAEEEFRKRLRQAVAESGGSRTGLARRLQQEGLTLEQWERETKNSFLVQAYVARRFVKRVAVTRRMMLEYYDAHPEEFSAAETARMQIVDVPAAHFLPVGRQPEPADLQAARDQARKEIEKAAAELEQGKNFAQVARTYSKAARAQEGGVWPVMERGSYKSEQVEAVAFAQQAGQVSGIIETPGGFYIVKTLQAPATGRKIPFEQVQDQIEARLRSRRYAELIAAHLKDLQGPALTRRAEEFTRAVLEAAVGTYRK